MPKLRFKHSHSLHLTKTISYRALGSLATFAIAFLLTGKLAVSAAIGGFEVVAKLFLYYLHERAWYNFTEVKQSKPQPATSENAEN